MYDTDQEFTSYKTSPTDEFLPLIQRPELVLWLHPGSIEGGGGKVSRWRDDSGKGNHLTPPSEARAPDKVLKGLNGYDVVSFYDNVGRNSSNSKGLSKTGASPIQSSSTLFTVLRTPLDNNAYQVALFLENQGQASRAVIINGFFGMQYSIGASGDLNLTKEINSSWMIIKASTTSNGAHQLQINRGAPATGSKPHGFTFSRIYLGTKKSASPADIDVAEILIFNDMIPEENLVWEYLSKKYNIALS